MTIATSALVAQRLGQGVADEARKIATSVLAFGIVITSILAVLCWIYAPVLIGLIGAKGTTLELAVRYFRIVVTVMPIGAIGMMATGHPARPWRCPPGDDRDADRRRGECHSRSDPDLSALDSDWTGPPMPLSRPVSRP